MHKRAKDILGLRISHPRHDYMFADTFYWKYFDVHGLAYFVYWNFKISGTKQATQRHMGCGMLEPAKWGVQSAPNSRTKFSSLHINYASSKCHFDPD